MANAVERAGERVRGEVRRMSPWIEPLGRFGHAAKGAVYLLIGVLAAQAAIGSGGGTTGSQGALRRIIDLPFGQILLIAVAVGLAGYALWRFVQALMDTENKGSDAKGIATRTAYFIAGLIHAALAYSAVRLVMGARSGDEQSTDEWTAWLMSQPFGRWLVGLVGAAVIAAALYQFYQAYRAKFREHLKTGEMSATMRTWVIRIGRFGYAARGVVFAIIGGFLIAAAVQSDPKDARGLGGALQALSEHSLGAWLFGVVAVGLIAYGVFMFLQARYRRMVIG